MPDGKGAIDPHLLQRRFDLILSTVGDGVYGTDHEGNITFVNTAAARLLGYRAEEMVGKNAHDLLHHTRHDGTPYPRDDCPVTATQRDGTVHHVRGGEVFWRKDGKSVPVEFVSSPDIESGRPQGAVVTFRSTSERERVEQALRESEERFRRLSDATLEGVVISQEGRILDANIAFASLVGLEPAEIQGRDIGEFATPQTRDALSRHTRSGFEGPLEIELQRGDGTAVPVEVSARNIPHRGRMARVTTFRDVSDRKRADAELRVASVARPLVRKLIQDLVEAGGVAHQILQQVGRKFASDLSAKDVDALTRAFSEMGLGEVKVERAEEGRFTFTGTDLLERRPGSRVATCYFTLGYLSEAVSRVSKGEPTLGTEIDCQSRGSAQCKFIVQVKKPEEGLARRVKELV